MLNAVRMFGAALCCVVAVCTLAACEMGMHESLSRTDRDPYFEIPQVLSFRETYGIIIRWTADAAADEYILYRAPDESEDPTYSLIYRGTATEYHDVFSLDEVDDKYLYRLLKRRGGRIFNEEYQVRGKTGLGAVYGDIEDIQEPNNRAEDAAVLTYTWLESNSCYFQSNYQDNVSFYDEDWYKVFIPANCKADIVLHDWEVAALSGRNHFKMMKLNRDTREIEHRNPTALENYSNEDKWCYFAIVPNRETFEWVHDQAAGFGKFLAYNIRVSSISPMYN
jgi:hypothetical protein